MRNDSSRRAFLTQVGGGTLLATVGPVVAEQLGFSTSIAQGDEARSQMNFGSMEPLVRFMQETPIQRLQSGLADMLQRGETLKNLVAAAALANARSFGGEDYIGFHTFMALAPALKMSGIMPTGQAALPVFKVLYRNTNRIQERGGRNSEVLHSHTDADQRIDSTATAAELRTQVVARNMAAAENVFSNLVSRDPKEAMRALLPLVQDNPEVHRVVLPYRAWDMQNVVGTEHSLTLLRQSLHYCIQSEPSRRADWDEHGRMLTSMIDEFRLLQDDRVSKQVDDQFVDRLAQTFATASPSDAARAAAEAIAEGVSKETIGEAISLAATMLVLRDSGRPPQYEDRLKPAGSVHGDSRGVHASDAANAWRNLAMVMDGASGISCLLIGAWQVARDRGSPSDGLREALPAKHHLDRIRETTQDSLLKLLDDAIVNNLQGQACAVAHQYGKLDLPPESIFKTLLQYAVSEDGALHAEKYFYTVWDDFHKTRPSLRWRHVASLARVTASEYGKPAAGQAEARELIARP
ncbi:MAG: hypothetical protein ABL921_30620 [Pirellula sp.]